MGFEILQARTTSDVLDRLYPTPGPDKDSVMREPEDGDRLLQFACAGAITEQLARGTKTELARVENIRGRLTITDSRFVFACTAFQTGGGFMGGGTAGVLVAAAANAASKAMNARETRGYTLVGHVRYEWLGAITAVDRRWGKTQNSLKLTFRDPTPDGRVSILTVYPPNGQPSAAMGLEVARRAARWQARSRGGSERAALEAWAEDPASSPTGGGNGRAWVIPD